jgi:hypothetical protein
MKKLSGFIIVAAVVLAGCTKGYYDINTNPNASTNASVDLVLANALKTTADKPIVNNQPISTWMGYWGASGSYAQSSSDAASYFQSTSTADGGGTAGLTAWTNMYNNLEDYDYVEQTSAATNQYFYQAAAKVMKAYVYGQLVDNFNNVPYSQALKGTANLTPVYDNGKDIYEALSTDLGAAVVLFQRADAVGSATQDILFGGVNTNWAKFANSLRLRLLLRQTEMSGRSAYIQQEITKIVNNGAGFLTINAGVNPGYTNSTGKQNPFYGFCINTAGTYIMDYWRASAYAIASSVAHNDLRYTRWYAPTSSGAYVGCVEGGVGNPVGSGSSTFGPGVLQSVSQPAILMTSSESYFLQAEAILRGFLPGAGSLDITMVNNGITANFTYLGLTAAQAATYYSQASDKQADYAACTNFTEKIACIMRQEWAADNMTTPYEAWANYRRLGLPADIPLTSSSFVDVNPPKIPFRILYPIIEYQTNAANVGAQGSINHHTSKIFWMP